MSDEQTFWNYEPTPCRKVRIVVGPCERETYWHNGLEGTEREAVEVNYRGEIFYLDNEDTEFQRAGQGWAKVTQGRGGPDWGHAEIPVAKISEEPRRMTAPPQRRSRPDQQNGWKASLMLASGARESAPTSTQSTDPKATEPVPGAAAPLIQSELNQGEAR